MKTLLLYFIGNILLVIVANIYGTFADDKDIPAKERLRYNIIGLFIAYPLFIYLLFNKFIDYIKSK